MEKAIREFAEQFAWQPKVINASSLKKHDRVIICGMGGSHLAADILARLKSDLRIMVWSDYGLPYIPKNEIKKTLVILSSYSGNTEETVDAFHAAGKMKLQRAVITAGGKLTALAEREKVPTVVMPDWGLQPRAALGLNLKGLLAIMGEHSLLREAAGLSRTLQPKQYESQGKALAKSLRGKVPIIYASHRNYALAYNWKIKFNETGKIPAFYNVLPELNHNEMTGFDMTPKSNMLSRNFYVLILTDPHDHPRIQKRMRILAKLYRDRGLPVQEIPLRASGELHKVFSSLILADWAAYYTAKYYGANPTDVPMVEEFKASMR